MAVKGKVYICFFMVTLGFEVNADKKFSQKKLKEYLLNVWRR